MKLSYEQLQTHLDKPLAPVYWISGDEGFLVQEACTAILQSAQGQGFEEPIRFHVDSGFSWSTFQQAYQNLSLFSHQQILDLRLADGKLDVQTREALTAYFNQPRPEKLLLVRSPKLDATQLKIECYQAFERQGVVLPIPPVPRERLSGWIKQRLNRANIQVTPEIAELLAQRVEGNLWAAAQEIEKLQLIVGEGVLERSVVLEAVTDHAQDDVYRLVDLALLGQSTAALRSLSRLKAEGLEAPIVLWALARDIRMLAAISQTLAQGISIAEALRIAGVWEKRKPLLQKALRRETNWSALLNKAAAVDRVIKGAQVGSVWDTLETLTLNVAGVILSTENVHG